MLLRPTPWLTLACVVAVGALAYVEWMSERTWVDQWLPNLATEIIGIAVTVAIVNTLFERAAHRRREEERAPLVAHVRRELDETLDIGIRASISVAEDSHEIRRLSAASLAERAAKSLSPASSGRHDEWSEFWFKELEAVGKELGMLRTRYTNVLSSELVRSIDIYVDGAAGLTEIEGMARAARSRGRMDDDRMAEFRLSILNHAFEKFADVIRARDEFIGTPVDIEWYWAVHDSSIEGFAKMAEDIPR